MVTVLSLFGGSKIVQMFLERHWSKDDGSKAIHETNQAAQIASESQAFSHILTRLKSVEDRVNDLTDKLADEKALSARLGAENEGLKRDNVRLETEWKEMRTKWHELRNLLQTRDGQILSFQKSLDDNKQITETLRKELYETQKELNSLKRAQ